MLHGDTSLMIWKIPEIISYVSDYMTLYPGDLILTGTPKGVGRVNPGQKITAEASWQWGKRKIQFPVLQRSNL